MADSYRAKSSSEDTDLGLLWEEALMKYYEESGTDLRSLPVSRLNFDHIKAEQDHQLLLFSEHRHDKGKLDRLRSLVAQNSQIILGVASHIANAASAAFPPSAAILTAFNYVMNASRAVSEDYDMIVSFFDVMNSFLERISVLESRMPGEWQFRRFLINVFSSMMTLSAIARKCRLKGRLSKWAKALIDGSDPKLKGAFDSLHMHLQRFESAAMLTTLKHTLESGKKLDALGQGVKQIQDGVRQTQISVEKNLLLSQENYTVGLESKGYAMDAASTSHDILTVVTRQEERGAEYTTGLHQVLRTLNKMSDARGQQQDQLVDAGARKSIAMRALEGILAYTLDDKEDFTRVESYYVDGTYSWFRTQDIYNQFESGKVQLLWLSGCTGIGKSTLCYTVVKALQDEFVGDDNTTVAHFFFHGDGDRVFMSQMLRSCALQIAVRNGRYREEAVADAQIYQKSPRDRLGTPHLTDDIEKLWELFFQAKFNKESGRRLILVLDGIDETDEKDRRCIDMILRDISSSENNIQILFACDPSGFAPDPDVKVQIFEMTQELIRSDIPVVVLARLGRLSRLRKLSHKTKRRIISKLSKQADTMRYIDHMIRKFDQIGRSETAVLRQLNNLHSCTSELYQAILEECQKGRSEQELVVLKKLFAWLSYRTEPLYVGCARMFWHHIDPDDAVSLDEELENRCSSILRLSTTLPEYDYDGEEGEDYDDTDVNTVHSDDEKPVGEEEDDSFDEFFPIVSFQEKGLRRYFQPLNGLGDSLRTSASSGHVIILEVIRSMLCNDAQPKMDFRERTMYSQAATTWSRHLQAIDPSELCEEETTSVIESIYSILSDKGGSIRKIEFVLRPAWDLKGYPCVLGKTDEDIEKTLECLQSWAVRVAKPPPGLLETTAAWMRPIARSPDILFIKLAQVHIANWFASYGDMDDGDINNCYLFAHYALYRGRHLPAVQENQLLRTYLMERAEKGDITFADATEDSFIAISSAFPHIDMTARSYLSVALSMNYDSLGEPCLRQLDLAIRQAHMDIERMEIYLKMAEIRMGMVILRNPEDGGDDDVDRWNEEAFEALTKAADIVSRTPDSVMASDSKTREVGQAVWLLMAQAEVTRGDAGNAVAYCRRALDYGGLRYWVQRYRIIDSLAEAKNWAVLLEVVDVLSASSRLNGVICLESHVDAIHRAAKATGRIEDAVERYRGAVTASQELMGYPDVRLMVSWARFYYDVVGTLDAISEAKILLNKSIEAKRSHMVAEASFLLSDILLKEFIGAAHLDKKKATYSEMQHLVRRLSEFMGSEFDPSQSQTAIPLAHMARKIDPVEFQRGLEQTFEGCVAALTDEAGWNDTLSLRVLARVLALVGLEREAQIAATCQLYVLDMEIFKRENDWRIIDRRSGGSVVGSENPEDSDDESAEDSQTNELPLGSPSEPMPSESDQEEEEEQGDEDDDGEGSAADESSMRSDVADGDLNWDSGGPACTDCGTRIWRWSLGPVYLCYYCTEVDLCQECFDKRAERLAGKPTSGDEWRVICPGGHKHIKMPVPGWKGLAGGLIKIDKTEVPFRDWLMELKEKKWPDAWERFWSSE